VVERKRKPPEGKAFHLLHPEGMPAASRDHATQIGSLASLRDAVCSITLVSGDVAALDHRLIAAKPSASARWQEPERTPAGQRRNTIVSLGQRRCEL
jgi:hypothetical protein